MTDLFDIDAFVMAIMNRTQYEQQYPGCAWLSSDCDGDGRVDVFDIDMFVILITSGD